MTFVADSMQADGETARENAPGPLSTRGMAHPELAGTTHEALLSQLHDTLEWKLWIDAKGNIDEINEDIARLEKSLSDLAEAGQTIESYHDANELRREIEEQQRLLAEIVTLAQPIHDSLSATARGFLESAVKGAFETLLTQRQAILAELAEAADPFLDRMVINADAMLRRDHGTIPDIGPRPVITKAKQLETATV